MRRIKMHSSKNGRPVVSTVVLAVAALVLLSGCTLPGGITLGPNSITKEDSARRLYASWDTDQYGTYHGRLIATRKDGKPMPTGTVEVTAPDAFSKQIDVYVPKAPPVELPVVPPAKPQK